MNGPRFIDTLGNVRLYWFLLATMSPFTVVAQESQLGSSDTTSSVTFVAQLGYNFRVSGHAEQVLFNDRKHYYTSDLTWLWPAGRHASAGVGTFIGIENGGEVRGGAKLHLRASYSGAQLGFQTGLLFFESRSVMRKPTLMAGASVGWDDWVTVRTQVELAAGNTGGPATATYVGFLLGSTAGKVGHLLVGAVVLIVGILALSARED